MTGSPALKQDEEAGVEEYWVVDIERDELTLHLLQDGKYQKSIMDAKRLESAVVAGFYIQVDWLWQKPLPSAFDCLKEMLGM